MFFKDEPWPMPSVEVQELLRQGCAAVLARPDDLVALVDQTVERTSSEGLRSDPSLMELVRASNRSNVLHWARWNVEHPGQRVAPNIGPVTLDIARDVVRRGFEDYALHSYRRGEAVAWQYFMDMAFALTEDREILRELLDVAARSIFTFVDDTLAGIEDQIEQERRDLVSGAAGQRLAAVQLLLEGAPLSAADAERRLRYDLAGPHTAAIMWSDTPTAELERVATETARRAGAVAPLVVAATVQSLWVWFPGGGEALAAAWELPEGLRAAVGATRHGVEGFRQSHLDAQVTRRLMRLDDQIVRFEQVHAVALASDDGDRVTDFVHLALGPLASAEEELRATVRTYLRQDCNVAATARALHVHRNTVVNRLDTAGQLVPGGLAGRAVEVGLGLELLRWGHVQPAPPRQAGRADRR